MTTSFGLYIGADAKYRFKVLIDTPSDSFTRQAIQIQYLDLTPVLIEGLSRPATIDELKQEWKSADIEGQWNETVQAKRLKQKRLRANLTDFERFKVVKLTKEVMDMGWLFVKKLTVFLARYCYTKGVSCRSINYIFRASLVSSSLNISSWPH